MNLTLNLIHIFKNLICVKYDKHNSTSILGYGFLGKSLFSNIKKLLLNPAMSLYKIRKIKEIKRNYDRF